MIFMPPRHGKSMTVTATFPSYYLGKYPDRRVIEVSYGDDLAKEFGDANRMKIAEHGYELFGVLLSQTAASKACRKRDEETDGEWFPVLYKLNKTGEGKTSYKRFEGWNY